MTKIKLATEKFVYDLTGVSSITTKPESKVVNGETLYRMCTKDGLTIFNAALDICPNHDKHEDNWLVPADYIFSLVVETPEIEINVYPRVHFAGYLEISGDIRVTYGKLPVGTYHLRTHTGGEYFPQSDTFDVDDSFEYTTFNFPRSSSTVDQNYYLKDISLYYTSDGGLYLKADCNITTIIHKSEIGIQVKTHDYDKEWDNATNAQTCEIDFVNYYNNTPTQITNNLRGLCEGMSIKLDLWSTKYTSSYSIVPGSFVQWTFDKNFKYRTDEYGGSIPRWGIDGISGKGGTYLNSNDYEFPAVSSGTAEPGCTISTASEVYKKFVFNFSVYSNTQQGNNFKCSYPTVRGGYIQDIIVESLPKWLQETNMFTTEIGTNVTNYFNGQIIGLSLTVNDTTKQVKCICNFPRYSAMVDGMKLKVNLEIESFDNSTSNDTTTRSAYIELEFNGYVNNNLTVTNDIIESGNGTLTSSMTKYIRFISIKSIEKITMPSTSSIKEIQWSSGKVRVLPDPTPDPPTGGGSTSPGNIEYYVYADHVTCKNVGSVPLGMSTSCYIGYYKPSNSTWFNTAGTVFAHVAQGNSVSLNIPKLPTYAEVSDPGNYFVAYYGSSFDAYRGDTRIYPGTLL